MALGNITGVSTSGDTLTISIDSDKLIVQACKPEILKVDYQPNGVSTEDTQVIDPTKTWGTGNTTSIDTVSDPMVITTSKMIVKISKAPCRVSVYDISNKLCIQEQTAGGVYSGGVKFTHNSGDNFYGIGEDGSVLKNSGGSVYAGYQGHSGAPFVWSNKGYGLLVDSDGGNFTINTSGLEFSNVSKTDTEYYVMVGKPKEILSAVGEITGKSPMFPKWAMGFTNTEWGITETELKSIVDTYRSKQIPIDNYCLDFDWKNWGDDNYGDFTWNGTKFPSAPSGTLMTQMAAKGIKLTGILKPRVHVDTVQGRDVTNNGWWLPGSSPLTDYCSGKTVNNLDFSKAGLRTWFFNHLKEAFDKGIQGWWNDEADENPAFKNWGHFNMEKGMYEGQRAYKNQRVWSINRNFYLGAQRYAFGFWTGDINTGFDSMKDQRRRMIGSINLGLAKWGMDTGGFNGGDPSPENYARWIQFSAFVPIFRVHGQQNKQRQPWVYGTIAEAAAKNVMQLRYKLIPYIYAYERQAFETGVGLVKPLVFDYPEDTNVADYKDAWMFGDYMLVAPVVDEGQTSKSIYLPAGTWIDYFRGTIISGAQTINYPVNSSTWNDVPLFIKKGAIIPSQDFMNYVGEKTVTTIYVDVFPDTAQTTFKYYDDDGQTYNYETEEYFAQTMMAQGDANSATFNISSKQGTYTPALQYYITKIHFTGATSATVNGSSLTKYASYTDLQAAAGEGWAEGTDTYGAVAYVKVAAGISKNIIVAKKQDITPPTAPTNLQTPSQTGYTVSLSWTASTDDVGVAGYSVFRNDVDVTPTLVSGTTYTDRGLTPLTTYKYYVIAKDSVGHVSLKSNEINATTKDVDSTPPTAPSNVNSTGKTSTSVSLSWTAATDNIGVAGYEIYRNGAKVSGTTLVAGTIYTDTGLSASTTYTYYVIAKDDAGNASVASNQISVMTDVPPTNLATIYYKHGYSAPYFHYKQANGTWTTVPGVKMTDSADYSGYSVIKDIDMGTMTQLEACFNDGNGNWDNNGSKNYFFPVGTSTFIASVITSGTPPVSTKIPVTFTVYNATTYYGQNVYITGSVPELSNWAPATAIGPASNPNYPTWTITINVPSGQNIQFKAIKKDGSGNIVWEGGNNHSYTVPASGNGNVSFDWQN